MIDRHLGQFELGFLVYCTGPQVRLLARQDGHEASKPLMAFTVGLLEFYECDLSAFWTGEWPSYIPEADGDIVWVTSTSIGDSSDLNDITVFSKMSKDHLVWLRAVFQKLKEAGLKLKPSKCGFF